uniref:(California timema) hypothetical protein n=1 Tax=Timema californicum TaxID=61474 RepID=A0A7R9J073_TIMCA|nr:unnamed protein product [Timema californicum]
MKVWKLTAISLIVVILVEGDSSTEDSSTSSTDRKRVAFRLRSLQVAGRGPSDTLWGDPGPQSVSWAHHETFYCRRGFALVLHVVGRSTHTHTWAQFHQKNTTETKYPVGKKLAAGALNRLPRFILPASLGLGKELGAAIQQTTFELLRSR